MVEIRFRTLWHETARGKSIWRILMNDLLRRWRQEIHGVVLDLACGQSPSYRRVLGLNDNERVRLVSVDCNPDYRPTAEEGRWL